MSSRVGKTAWGNNRDKWEEKVDISVFFYVVSKLLGMNCEHSS